MDATDKAYYLRRALQEQEAARIAKCLPARDRHRELAAAYRLRGGMDGLEPASIQNQVDYFVQPSAAVTGGRFDGADS